MKLHALVASALLMASTHTWATDSAGATSQAEPQATPTQQPSSTDEPTTTEQTGNVVRAAFSSAIENREPVDQLTQSSANRIYYFSELRGMSGQRVTHRWEHNGKIMAEVPFEVGGDRWRIYSSKRILPEWNGEWKASVVSSDGSELAVNTVNLDNIQAAEEAPSQENAAPEAAPESGTTNQ